MVYWRTQLVSPDSNRVANIGDTIAYLTEPGGYWSRSGVLTHIDIQNGAFVLDGVTRVAIGAIVDFRVVRKAKS